MDIEDLKKEQIDFYSSINPIELMEKIRSFRKLDFKNMTYEDIAAAISDVLTHDGKFMYPTNIQKYPKGTQFFRLGFKRF